MAQQKQSKTSLLGLRIVLIASLFLFLVATLSEVYLSPPTSNLLPPTTDRSSNDEIIVPGFRVGPVTLGLRSAKLREVIGRGVLRPHGDGIVHLHEDLGLVIYEQDGRVTSITVRSPYFATRQGLRVGSDVSDVFSTLGNDYEMEKTDTGYTLTNFNQGWRIAVENDLITSIHITPSLGVAPLPPLDSRADPAIYHVLALPNFNIPFSS